MHYEEKANILYGPESPGSACVYMRPNQGPSLFGYKIIIL